MRVRFAQQAVLGILLICSPADVGQEKVEGCTIGVASSKATADGRPLLWKNSDGEGGDREVVYRKDGRFKYQAVAYAQWPEGPYAGVNEFGFCMVTSVAFNLPNESKKGLGGEGIMRLALQQCVTADDFESLLKQTNVSGRTTTLNIGVIDAFGGAAIFETGNFSYTRFDATDPKVAPQGYIVRTGFAFTGSAGGGFGRARYDRASQLWQQAVEKDQLDYRNVLRKVCRDLSGAEKVSYRRPEMDVTETSDLEVLDTENSISGHSTNWVALFHGVREDENPSLTTFWAIMGEPILSVAVPGWVIAESTAPEMDGAERSPLCTAARVLHLANYVMGDKQAFLLNPEMLPDIWALTYPAEDRIFDQTESILSQWRQDYPTAKQVASFHQQMASEATDALKEIVELVVQKGAKIGNLHIALYTRDLEKAKALIRRGIDVNVLDGYGYVPLHYAVENNQKEIVQLLISKDADVNARDASGLTALHIAAHAGHKEMVELLLARGADINARETKWGGTPLNSAIWGGHVDVAEVPLANGANFNVKGNYNWTPLHDAAWHGRRAIVELLIARGADIHAKAEKWATTPLDSATSQGHKDIVELLREHGAKE